MPAEPPPVNWGDPAARRRMAWRLVSICRLPDDGGKDVAADIIEAALLDCHNHGREQGQRVPVSAAYVEHLAQQGY